MRLATNAVLLKALEALANQDAEAAEILSARFPDNQTLYAVANKLNVSDYAVSRRQKAAIEVLTDVILDREWQRREEMAQMFQANLPPASYRELFGVEAARAKLLEQLLNPDARWVVAIVGMGGIGKTALADAVVREAIKTFYFESVVWLRVEPQTMSGRSLSPEVTFNNLIAELLNQLRPDSRIVVPQQRLVEVRRILKSSPHLIVVDNLETETDTAYLLAHLSDLANPGKFLLTSRTRAPNETVAYHFPVDELSLESAIQLLKHHAASMGITVMNEATTADLKAIYDVTGGNPLALKLVVNLLDVQSLPQVLEGLIQSPTGPAEALYRRIYQQTWQTLSESARQLLKCLPLVGSSGADSHYLQIISGLSESQLWPAIQELRTRSLLEVWGSLHDKKYGIHRLTETFLKIDVIRWPTE
ncbi:MAG: NB-ARC domain-containing protein [Candidatus Promineifilaceae bacterium]